jgi:aminoglycoside phosphotransferase family enzyme
MLINLKKVFSRLIANYAFRTKKTKVFTTLKAYSNNKVSVRANVLSFGIAYPYKKTDFKRKHY